MFVCMYVCMYVCTYVCMYARMYVCMYVCMHVCMHACMSDCVCVYIYIYNICASSFREGMRECTSLWCIRVFLFIDKAEKSSCQFAVYLIAEAITKK